jgi:(2Fe-2S) ferredoxin
MRRGRMGRHVWVCLGASCRRSGSPEVWEQLTQALAAEADVEVRQYGCFGACAVSPNILVMPERVWYSYVMSAYVPQVTEAIRQGAAIPGLANHVPPMIRDAVVRKFAQGGES